MKTFATNLIKTLTALVIITGAFFILTALCGFSARLPKGVTVNGVDVGGLTYGAAKSLLREGVISGLKAKELHICADERVYAFAYPEVDFTDGFGELLPSIRKSGDYSASVKYHLNGMKEIVENICGDIYKAPQEPYALFNTAGDPFTYYDGADGVECDGNKLTCDILASLEGGENGNDFEKVRICTRVIKRSLSGDDIKKRTQKLYSFTTYFDGDNLDRSENIRLAARKINGTQILPNEVFSFNAVVGARTEDNGFKPAKIIEDGKFVLGYGGGVCQVSTTLYNAALLSGLEIAEYHPHSLQVGYVAPSRDAMVSGSYFDLKFKNNRLTPIYVRVNCTLSSVTCTVYGESDGYRYSFKSEVVETFPRPQTVVVEGGEDKILSYGRDGTKSEGYLVKSANGVDKIELIRKDKYLAVADVVQKKREENDENEECGTWVKVS